MRLAFYPVNISLLTGRRKKFEDAILIGMAPFKQPIAYPTAI
jgi:hypothetical protein